MSDERQVDIKTATFRVLHDSPGHVTVGVWVNGGKCGDLVMRQNERVAMFQMLRRGGFEEVTL